MRNLVLLMWLFGASPALAATLGDPTFNGMVKVVHCFLDSRTFCSGNYLHQYRHVGDQQYLD